MQGGLDSADIVSSVNRTSASVSCPQKASGSAFHTSHTGTADLSVKRNQTREAGTDRISDGKSRGEPGVSGWNRVKGGCFRSQDVLPMSGAGSHPRCCDILPV